MPIKLDDLNIRCEPDASLAPLTWYGIGGKAELLAHPADADALQALVRRCRDAGVKMRVLGSGANLLIADEGVTGVVVQLDEPGFRTLKTDGTTVTAGAGYDLAELVLETAREGLGGLECLAGIPASVGGALRMNAGGTYGDIGQTVSRVRLMDETGEIFDRNRDDLVFAYRRTNIVAPIILEAEFELTSDDPEALMRQVKEIFLYKRNSQPLAANSPGCAFKNPEDADDLTAGALIDRAGLKGYRIGGAEVSQRHANFIVADEGCTAGDVLAVLDHVEKTVLERFGIKLQREVVVWR